MSSAASLNLGWSQNGVLGNGLKHGGQERKLVLGLFPFPSKPRSSVLCNNPFPNKPWFLRVCSTSLMKTLWEKEKLLVKSNFSFSLSVFSKFDNFLPFSSNLKLSSAKSFGLEEPEICRLGKG